MMCGKRKLLVVLAGLASILPAIMLWDATDRRLFTVFPPDGQTGQSAPAGSSGAHITSQFGLGLLPAGGGREAISLLTFALPIGVIVLVALLSGRHEACKIS